ncbi:MAG TPA: hypothetical protein DCY82_07290 [Acidimicrobiaceae bacterium]|nr:hypothetical protein [Acidimicrobiaceae bacterium]
MNRNALLAWVWAETDARLDQASTRERLVERIRSGATLSTFCIAQRIQPLFASFSLLPETCTLK